MNKIKNAIEELTYGKKEGKIEFYMPDDKETIDIIISALIKQLPNKTFEWHKCKRKNGTEFLKLIYYSTSVNGYIEVGRFNMSNQELIQSEWSLDEIVRELN